MPARRLAALAITLPLLATVIACGSPDSPLKTFVFTPVPYTVTPPPPGCLICGEALSVGESGELYFADQISLEVDPSAEARITQLIDEFGFSVENRRSNPADVNLLVRVPPGSAKAVVSFFQKQDGVQNAALNVLLRGG
jgi:hypothetical protein